MFELWQIAAIAIVGLGAGLLGGMLGVGGSIVMIPALVLLFGQNVREGFNQHLYQAAAMIVNVFVAVPATLRHHQHGAVQKTVLMRLIPAALIGIFAGVWLSNRSIFAAGADELDLPAWFGGGPALLGKLLGLFMLYVIAVNIRKLSRPPAAKADAPLPAAPPPAAPPLPHCLGVGLAMGLVAGLLGIGGGAVAVPLQQVVLKLPLRNCIANSAAVICLTAGFGAFYKNATLAPHGLDVQNSLWIAALLAPTALIGGYVGGRLTHTLPSRQVRLAFVLLLSLAAIRMMVR